MVNHWNAESYQNSALSTRHHRGSTSSSHADRSRRYHFARTFINTQSRLISYFWGCRSHPFGLCPSDFRLCATCHSQTLLQYYPHSRRLLSQYLKSVSHLMIRSVTNRFPCLPRCDIVHLGNGVAKRLVDSIPLNYALSSLVDSHNNERVVQMVRPG